jgi:large subunit ribosomal protein L4
LYEKLPKAVSPLPTLNEIGEDLPEQFRDEPFREGLIHQAVVTHEANKRADLAKAKDRSEVAGANQKPWRQKGTGRSRHGSRISPLWVGGGRAHAPDGTQDHSKNLTKKMKQKAFASALSVRCQENSVYCLDDIELDEPSTQTMDDFFKEHDLTNALLLLYTTDEDTLRLSTRNLAYCQPSEVSSLNTYEIVSNQNIVFSDAALEQFRDTRVNS